jgi:tetraacyldisaccharide 4'-kinase
LGVAATSALARRVERAWLRRGPLALSLLPLALPFAALTALHRALFRVGWLHSEKLGVPVVVVGNLVAGGAGKTPTVIAVVALLRAAGRRPGIVSRGYGRDADAVAEVQADSPAAQVGDEPLLLIRRTGVPVVVGRDRVAAARALCALHPKVDIIVSDDGLQHRRLARDVEVLVFDERGAGNGWPLPAGPLREPLPVLLAPRSLVVYNAPAASTPLPGFVAQPQLAGVASLQRWWQGEPASLAALQALRGRPIVAAAGMARPQRFFAMLRAQGLSATELALPDHHDFATLPWPADTADVVVTEKDAVKLDPARLGRTRVWVATLDFALGADFAAALAHCLAEVPTDGRNHGNATA